MDDHGFQYSQFSPFYNTYPPYQVQQQPSTSNFHYTMPLGANSANFYPNVASPAPSTSSQQSEEAASESNSPQNDSSEKRTYEKWTDDEQKLLVNLWAENFERIESKESRKVWDEIADKVNKAFQAKRPKRTTKKFKEKIKYLLDRYKKAKDWNKKQSGGHKRKSIFYDEIDRVMGCREIVELQHVAEAGTSASSTNTSTGESSVETNDEEAEAASNKQEKRTERKKKRKRVVGEEAEEEERKFFKTAVEGLQAQREDMNNFINNFNDIQTQQLNTMNTLVGSLAKFLEKQ